MVDLKTSKSNLEARNGETNANRPNATITSKARRRSQVSDELHWANRRQRIPLLRLLRLLRLLLLLLHLHLLMRRHHLLRLLLRKDRHSELLR